MTCPLNRRQLVATSAAFAASAAVAGPALAGTHPAVRYMQKVTGELLAAQRQGSIASFRSVLKRHADIASIATYALGRYRYKLSNSKRSAYYRGVLEFMSRYFANQVRKHRVVNAAIHQRPRKESGGYLLVDTSVKLASGSTYTVTWRLSKQRGKYKINDVKVLGFSLAFLQRGIFYKFLTKRNGNVNALVAALNR